ncbi:MAG TPA: Ig-like domain-containing protein, partial [Candidatus Thermoplasmatota archaeon]
AAPGRGAAAVWSTLTASGDNVMLSTFDPGGGWSFPATVHNHPAAAAGGASDVALADDGGAMVVSENNVNPAFARPIVARERDTDGTWGAQVTVNGTALGYAPRVVSLSAGTFLAVWAGHNGSAGRMVSSLSAGGAWGPAVDLAAPARDIYLHELVADGTGGAFALWRQGDDVEHALLASRFTPSTGWSPAVPLLEGVPALEWTLASDGAGGAVAAWAVENGSATDLRAAHYVAGTGWAPNVTVASGPGVGLIRAAASLEGLALLAWWELDTGNQTGVLRAAWGGPIGWSEVLGAGDPIPSLGSLTPSLALRADGSGLVAFSTLDSLGVYRLTLAPFGGQGWGPRATLHEGGLVLPVQTFAFDDGSAVVAGRLDEAGAQRLVAFHFQAPDEMPPGVALTSPADGLTTGNSTLRISGVTEPGARVTVNGLVAQVAPNGSFSLVVPLEPGPNTVRVFATDAAGNTATAFLTVDYRDASSASAARVAELEAALADLNRSLEILQEELATARAAANATGDRLDAFEGGSGGDGGAGLALALAGVAVALAAAALVAALTRRKAASEAPSRPPP